MDPSEGQPKESGGRRSRLNSGIVAAGAAFAMTLAGLGVAAAQIDSATTTTEAPTTTVAPDQAAPEGQPGGPAGPGHRRFGHHHGGRASLTTAAEAIGISEADLLTALRSGQSIAQVAESKGVEAQTVVDALVAEARERLAEAVSAGRLTQARADEKAADLPERITAMVNATGGLRCHGGPGFGGHRPPPPGEDAPAAEPASVTA